MSTDSWAVVATASVSIVAILTNSVATRADRRHAVGMARRARRSDAYLEILTAVRVRSYPIQLRMQLVSKGDFEQEARAREDRLDEDEFARLDAFGSPGLHDALNAWSAASMTSTGVGKRANVPDLSSCGSAGSE
jgi:hypothetical protein